MSRIAKKMIIIPKDVICNFNDKYVFIYGKNGNLKFKINKFVNIIFINNKLKFFPFKISSNNWSFSGTTRSLVNNMIIGVTKFFFKKLLLVGIGYKAIVENNKLILFLGFSHSINYLLPNGVFVKCINQTEIIINGCDKQLVGQVAANLLIYRKFEPYKGKGVRYFDKIFSLKEVKKKK